MWPIVDTDLPEKGPDLVHLVGIAQSLGLFFVMCLATAAFLSLAMAALARMERATVTVRASRLPTGSADSAGAPRAVDRVSSPGGVTYGPRPR
jgi:hypothetical protein